VTSRPTGPIIVRVRIAEGHTGAPVRDVQRRLLGLGKVIAPDELAGAFGPTTKAAVMELQQERGLVVDGIVGRETWRALVEASWRLGDRTLYLQSPNLRGDDVRGLQERMMELGFDCGRVDGIFGPRTAKALADFQGNYGLDADGIASYSTFRALAGLPSLGGDMPVGMVREREALRHRSPTLAGMAVVVDPGHGGHDPGFIGPSGLREDFAVFRLALQLESALAAAGVDVFLTRDERGGPPDEERAALANTLGADLFVSLHAGGSTDAEACGASTYYFGHERFHSEAGRSLAETIQEELVRLGLTDDRAHGKTWGILRETRMPAVQIEPGYITNAHEESLLKDPVFVQRTAEAILGALRRFARTPVPA
jgi:N-acetylmuramoyl-L-alanine amidase